MQQQDIISLLGELRSSLVSSDATGDTSIMQQKIAPMLVNDLQQNVIKPASSTVTHKRGPLKPKNLSDSKNAFPASNQLLEQSPAIFKALSSKPTPGEGGHPAAAGGASILQTINLNNIN